MSGGDRHNLALILGLPLWGIFFYSTHSGGFTGQSGGAASATVPLAHAVPGRRGVFWPKPCVTKYIVEQSGNKMFLLKFNSQFFLGCALLVLAALLVVGCGTAVGNSTDTSATTQDEVRDHANNPYWSSTDTTTLNVPKSEWVKILPPELYHVAFEGGTERAFTGKYTDYKGDGTFVCAVCGHPLYDAKTEFHSGTGWPSFYQPLTPSAVGHRSDGSLGMERTEIICPRCGAHLGHVFEDGPQPTGLRYCMNSVSLYLVN